jgi:predicted phage baseplate assembly protein
LLELAEAPIQTPVCSGTAQPLELGALYTDLEPGRWIIVSGERTDIPGTSGVEGNELAMIASVEHDVRRAGGQALPGETPHTTITLATELSYCYRRDTATIYANVAHATHGETRKETLGGGNAAEAFQRFTLKAAPVTFTAAPTVEGAASTLEVRVNDVLWHECDTLADAKPTDRVFTTSTDDDAKTTITFGDGLTHGARLPTGIENVKAVYRNGIGRAANVNAKQISLLGSRPLGVKEVINPLRASGGADADTRDQARRNIPVALQALDRLISIRDYADFARSFAGVGNAAAAQLSDGERLLAHVTIAGADDVPILPSSDLFQNLLAAFKQLGDPVQPVILAVRELILLVISAGVRLQRDYAWTSVEPKIRDRLLERFGFDARELGRSVAASEVIAAIHEVKGVDYVDLNAFGGIAERVSSAGPPPVRRLITPDEIAQSVADIAAGNVSNDPAKQCSWPAPFCPVRVDLARVDENKIIAPAQLAILSRDVPATLILSHIENGAP